MKLETSQQAQCTLRYLIDVSDLFKQLFVHICLGFGSTHRANAGLSWHR